MPTTAIHDFITKEISSCGYYYPTLSDRQFIETHPIEEYIYRKVTSKKFRKWSLGFGEDTIVRNAININVRHNKPIQFVFPFGGYKLWRLPSASSVDWAELFATMYYCKYIAPIVAVYKPGAVFYYSSDSIVAKKMNNIPTKDTLQYAADLSKITSYIQRYLPENFLLKIKNIGDLYDNEDFELELNELVLKSKSEILNLDKEKYDKIYQSSALNYQFQGHYNFSNLNDEEQKNKIEQSLIIHEAYRNMSQKLGFVYTDNKIVLAAKPTIRGIALGTTKNSAVKFWVGTGIIEQHTDIFSPRILSYQQYINLDKNTVEYCPIDLLPLKNFEQIMIHKSC